MSHIDGLSIQGIRSFAPDHREAINLYTPLTLIVGYNGSGKTTLIECLKYATTGELPPNSKGGAFIHDPKLCNEKIVPASVGLKFTSVDGADYTLHRRIQVTLNPAGNRQLRTLESSMKRDGEERETTSKKVSDVDEDISRLLGVSPAILDSVIFCHQDEAYWPLSEPSNLKKRFDEIFEAQKYTKAIEQLKLVRKKQGESLRESKSQLIQDEESKNRAIENSDAIDKLNKEIADKERELLDLKRRCDEENQKMKEKREEASRFLSIVNDLENLENQYNFRQDAVKELRDSIDIMSEDDAELIRALNQYESRLDRLKSAIDEDTVRYHSLGDEVNEARSKLNSKLGEKGKLESDKEKHERQLETRIEMIQQAAGNHGIRGFDTVLDEEQIRVFNDKIQTVLNSRKKEHDRLHSELARTTDEANSKISELENKKSSLTSEKTFARQKRAENDRKIKRLQTEIDLVDCDESRITLLQKDQVTLEERYRDAQTSFSQNRWDEKIQSEKSKLSDLEKTNEELNLELVNCTRLSSERAQLDLRKKELKQREENLESLIGTFSGKISSQLGRDWNIESLGSDYKVLLADKVAVVNKAKDKCDTLQKQLDQLDFELAEARKRHTTMTESRKAQEESVLDALKDVLVKPDLSTTDEFLDELESLEEDKLQLEKDTDLFDHMKKFYGGAQTTLNTKNKCHLCERTFDDDRSKSKLMKKILKALDDDQKEAMERELRAVIQKVDRMRAVRSDFDGLSRFKFELPRIKNEINEVQEKREHKLQQLEAAVNEHGDAADCLSEVESVYKSVSDITQLHKDIKGAKEQVGRLQSQSQMSGTGRSADEIHNNQSANTEKVREVKKNLDSLTRERQRNWETMSNLELERSETKNKINQAKQQAEKRDALSKDVKALKEDNLKQEEMVSRIDGELKTIQPQIDAARGQRDAALERGREKQRHIAEERDSIAHTLSRLKIIEDDIQDYVDRGKASALASVERSMQSIQQQHENLKSEMSNLMISINSQKEELSLGDRKRKNINDNLRYREHCRTLDNLSEKIEQLKAHNAEEDYSNLMRQATYHADQESVLQSKKNILTGEIGAKDKELTNKLSDHERYYKGAEEKYKETRMKVETKKLAIDDLATYGNAVDQAIMEYHSLKMEEVNRIAGELWRATYQGTDIDTIAIRSENEKTPSNNSRRSYNYRLTMVKQDTEMDMRGRCSAGQKVLASIIIRLALAESFGVSCGLIALDEPTTNLDSDNIRSLAVSLHGIIKARQAQANFQLIVITHDEEFLRAMRCNEFCDKFYRIKRDANQCSRIIKEDVSRITE